MPCYMPWLTPETLPAISAQRAEGCTSRFGRLKQALTRFQIALTSRAHTKFADLSGVMVLFAVHSCHSTKGVTGIKNWKSRFTPNHDVGEAGREDSGTNHNYKSLLLAY